jgi:phage-related protein (TIGR01555 family)
MADSMVNLVSNLGTPKDKRTATEWSRRNLSQEELSVMYKEDWLAGKIVDIPVDDMTRKWRTFEDPDASPEDLDKLAEADKAFGVRAKFAEALRWARLYGGAVMVLGVDGAGELEEELDLERVTEGSLKYALVLDRHDVEPRVENFTDPEAPDFRKPTYYVISSGSNLIHHSRVIYFDGLSLPWRERQMENYWGLSVLQRVYEAVLNASSIADSVSSMTYEAKIDVVQVKDLFHEISSKGSEAIAQRFLVGDQIKSINNMMLIDMDRESYEQKELQFTGLSDLILRYLNIAAAAADIPATRLLGESAPGLNATGVEQTRQYYDMVAAQQGSKLCPMLDAFDQIFVRSVLGYYPEKLTSSFDSLWQASEVEQSQIELSRAQADRLYIESGTITSSIAVKRLKAEGTYPIEDDYLEALEEIETAEIEGEIERAGEPPPVPPQMIPGQPPVDPEEEPVEEEPPEDVE